MEHVLWNNFSSKALTISFTNINVSRYYLRISDMTKSKNNSSNIILLFSYADIKQHFSEITNIDKKSFIKYYEELLPFCNYLKNLKQDEPKFENLLFNNIIHKKNNHAYSINTQDFTKEDYQILKSLYHIWNIYFPESILITIEYNDQDNSIYQTYDNFRYHI